MSFLLPPLPPHFEAALRDVHAKGHGARIAAAQRLRDPEDGRDLEARAGLVALLRDRHAQVRAAALESLEVLGDDTTWAAVRACLDDPYPMVRELAVLALAAVDHSERQPLLERLAGQTSADGGAVRFQALGALAHHHPDAALGGLLSATDDPDARVRQRTALLLGGWLPDPSEQEQQQPAHRLGEATEQVRLRLVALLEDQDPGVQTEAALSLAQVAEPRALAALRPALHDPAYRLDALEALGRYPAEAAEAAVDDVAALGTRALVPPVVNAFAGRSLLRMGRADLAVPCLREALLAMRGGGRDPALSAIAESVAAQASELAPLGEDLLRLAKWPRGASRTLLLAAAAHLAAVSPAAQGAIKRLPPGTKDQ